MHIITHRIRLHDVADAYRFEKWVREVDYATCPQLPSVRAFSVQRVSTEADADFHYFEVITVSGPEEFARDMDTEEFRGLAGEFETMAEVVEEFAGERIGAGYTAEG